MKSKIKSEGFKVLMIAPTPFFADRGCHTQIYEEIKALQKLGNEIVLCTYGLGRNVEGVTIKRTINFPWYKKLSAGPSYTKILLLPFLTFTVIKVIIRFKPDIIHAHLHEGALIARFCMIFFRKKKYLFDMQGSLTGETLQHGFVKENSLKYRLLAKLEKRIANWFFVITQSDSMVNELIRLNVPENKIRNVHDGVDTDIFKPLPPDNLLAEKIGIDLSKPRVLYMGLLEEYQGVDLLFEALSLVNRKYADAQFIIIGYPNEEKYKLLAQNLGFINQTFFLGRIEYQKLPAYLSLSNIAIAPKISPTEGDGKIYNYMAMGMATVAFDRSVSREILGEYAIYAKLKDSNDLADKIIQAIENDDLVKELGIKARERAVATLSWNAVGERIHEVYKLI